MRLMLKPARLLLGKLEKGELELLTEIKFSWATFGETIMNWDFDCQGRICLLTKLKRL